MGLSYDAPLVTPENSGQETTMNIPSKGKGNKLPAPPNSLDGTISPTPQNKLVVSIRKSPQLSAAALGLISARVQYTHSVQELQAVFDDAMRAVEDAKAPPSEPEVHPFGIRRAPLGRELVNAMRQHAQNCAANRRACPAVVVGAAGICSGSGASTSTPDPGTTSKKDNKTSKKRKSYSNGPDNQDDDRGRDDGNESGTAKRRKTGDGPDGNGAQNETAENHTRDQENMESKRKAPTDGGGSGVLDNEKRTTDPTRKGDPRQSADDKTLDSGKADNNWKAPDNKTAGGKITEGRRLQKRKVPLDEQKDYLKKQHQNPPNKKRKTDDQESGNAGATGK
ncbi:hypothetical protein VTI74DRAFT_4869 [Chaetomium olivicolor]